MSKNDTIDKIIELLQELKTPATPMFALREKPKPTSVWDLTEDDTCWIITGKGQVMEYSCFFQAFNARRAKGDVFLSQEAAKRELKARRLKASDHSQGLGLFLTIVPVNHAE